MFAQSDNSLGGIADHNRDRFTEDDTSKQLLSCPIDDCYRHGEPFEKTWRWREHMKRSHRRSKEQIAALEAELKKQGASSTKTEASVPKYSCHIDGCVKKGEPYQKAWRWREHMRRAHQLGNEDLAGLEREFGEGEEANVEPMNEDGIEVSDPGAKDATKGTGDLMPVDGFLRPVTVDVAPSDIKRARRAAKRKREEEEGALSGDE